MPYAVLLKRSFGLMLKPGLWLLALLMALDAVWQFALSTAFIYSSLITLLRDVAGEQLPPWLTSASLFGLCLGAGVLCLLISIWGEAALLTSLNTNNRASQSLRSGWPRCGALLIVRLVVALPTFLLSAGVAVSLTASIRALLQHDLNLEQFSLAVFGTSALLSVIGTAVIILAQCVAVGAERAAVLEKHSAGEALQLGWRLLWHQLGDFVVIGVLLLLISMLISAVLSCAGGVLLSGWFTNLAANGASAVNLAALFSLLVVGWLVMAFGYLFTTGVWTFAYQHWRIEQFSPRN